MTQSLVAALPAPVCKSHARWPRGWARAGWLALVLSLGAMGTAVAAPLRVATWNLGWHMDTALATQWMNTCGQPFARTGAEGRWRPDPAGTETGWSLRWGREAPIEWDIGQLPPCDVYQAGGRIVPVTPQAYATRQRQIREILGSAVKADVLALQEVSGRASVLEVLPEGGAGHHVCSYEGHKVQRLAFAWSKSLGPAVSCEVHWPLSLPSREAKEQPRPGLALTLRIEGRLVRFLTVHLKSSCVSPLDERREQGRGQLDSDEPNCQLLQAQVPALEAWVEAQSVGVSALVVLGDFNRNLQHEQREAASQPVRSQGAPTDPHRPGNRVRNLWRELNDGMPASSRLVLLETACPGDAAVQGLCERAKSQALSRPELQQLGDTGALGCRNPVGLDHIAVSPWVKAGVVTKVAVGLMGRTSPARENRPALLAVSDHCPLAAELDF